MLGAKLAHDSRTTFVIVVWAHVMLARNFFSNWPYVEGEDADCGFFWCHDKHSMSDSQVSLAQLPQRYSPSPPLNIPTGSQTPHNPASPLHYPYCPISSRPATSTRSSTSE